MDRELALNALLMAVWRRQPKQTVMVTAIMAVSSAAMTGAVFLRGISRAEHEPTWQLSRHLVYDELERLPNLTRATIGRMPLR